MSSSTVEASPFFAPNKKTPRRHTISGGIINRLDSENQQNSSGDEPKSSMAGAMFNLMNAIIGAGIVGVPYAVRECGFVWGMIMIIFCAILTVKSLRLLIGTAKYVNVPSYEMLAEAAFGKPGFLFVSLAMFVMSYGAMVTYLMIVKNVLPDLLGVAPDDLPLRRTLLALSSFCIMLPLSAQRDMAHLAKTSTISVLFDCIIVAIVAYFAPVQENIRQQNGLLSLLVSQSSSTLPFTNTTSISTTSIFSLLIPSSTFFIGLGVLSFAFVCQHSAFIIAGSLAQPTRKRWATVTASALISCCILAIIMGASGYLGYLDKVQGNILNNLIRPPTDPYFSRIDAVDAVVATQDDNNQSQQNTYIFFHKWSHLYNNHQSLPLSPEEVALHRAANIARALLCTAMFFVYPMEAFVARHVCVVLFFRGRNAHEGDDHYVLARRDRRLVMTMALYFLALIPALCFNNVGNVLAITGAIGGSALSYIGPGTAYLAIHGKAFLDLAHKSLEKQSLLPSESVIQEDEEKVNLLHSTKKEMDSPSVSHSTPAWYNHFLWYCCCLPIWCHVAQYGQDMLKKHKEEEALKSPSIHSLATPKPFLRTENSSSQHRLGGIPQFVVVDMKRGKLSSMGRSTSFEKTSITPASVSVLSPKRHIITYNSTSSTLPDTTEVNGNRKVQFEKVESEEITPTATDFVIAIFFIVFGILAASAGLFSVLF